MFGKSVISLFSIKGLYPLWRRLVVRRMLENEIFTLPFVAEKEMVINMIRYTSNSQKEISLFSGEQEEILYQNQTLENDKFQKNNIIVETKKCHSLSKLSWLWLFLRCFFSTVFKIIIMEINSSWLMNVDPFYVRTTKPCGIKNSINYLKSEFSKNGVLTKLPILFIDGEEVEIDIFVDYCHIKKSFLINSFELCWLAMICEILISLIFIFAGVYEAFLLILFLFFSIIIIFPTILKIKKSYKQYTTLLCGLEQRVVFLKSE